MTRAEAAAAIGRRVRVEGGSYDGWYGGRIAGFTRKLVEVRFSTGVVVRLSAYRLHLIDEPKEETHANP